MRAAAEIALMLGYGAAVKFLFTENTEERMRIQALAVGAKDIERERDLSRANMIAHEVSKIFGT